MLMTACDLHLHWYAELKQLFQKWTEQENTDVRLVEDACLLGYNVGQTEI